ncbi:hypothetical protein BD289DRAFT_480194 [Coniella lustricola]|uniref:t-SNARE coiled-coil homology domain-containing protein n=1 Tax=Coniella lustricola TaxID=2025994 RepID=A0A2T3AGK4_9PEZI|nr:hypothetical protein BD289DRAFT_480194 [Coniella lustricola]
MSTPNALFLLADHVKLSLLERKRAQALNLHSDSQDGHISRSLEQFRDGLEGLRAEQTRLQEAGEETKAATIADALPSLQKQFDDLTSQFHGFSSPGTTATLTHPNDPTLAEDFAHAESTTIPPTSTNTTKKSVRFTDFSANATAIQDEDNASAAALFGQPYRDDPDAPAGYRDHAAGLADNQQIHAYHSQVLADQDEQLDRLGESISRQRELSMQIGDELDDQVAMLEDQEALVDRHQGRLDRARNSVGKLARSAGESRQMVAIVVLIVILVLLIAILK